MLKNNIQTEIKIKVAWNTHLKQAALYAPLTRLEQKEIEKIAKRLDNSITELSKELDIINERI